MRQYASHSLQRPLVTGGAGFIGSHLVERLLDNGAETVTVLDNFSTGRIDNLAAVQTDPRLAVIQGDVTDRNIVRSAVAGCSMVFHLASLVGVQEVMSNRLKTLRSGARGLMEVMDAAAEYAIPTLFSSTSEVYGPAERNPLRETDRPAPGPSEIDRWGYGAVKLFGEYYALAQHREGGAPAMVVRLFNTVGPRQAGRYGMVLPRFVAAALAGEPLCVYGDGSQSRCFADVGDVVEALVALADTEAAFGKVVNIGGREEVSIRHLADIVKAETGSSSLLEFVPFSAVFGPSFEDVARRLPDVERLISLIGFAPSKPTVEIVRRTVEFMRHGRLVAA